MHVVYANQEPPHSWESAIFLAGPTPRAPRGIWERILYLNGFRHTESWRPGALRLLKQLGYAGVVFVPEDEHGVMHHSYDDQIEWEEKCLNLADVILFWVPRSLPHMPAFTTNAEWGFWTARDPLRLVFGHPKQAPKMRYLAYYAERFRIPIAHSLEETCRSALAKLRPVLRKDGERAVPAHLWHTPSFQEWYRALREAGNTLVNARVEWVATSTLRPGRPPIVYSLRPWIHCDAEDRIKSNETVIFRPAICAVAVVKRGVSILDSEVVTIREFRPAVSNQSGFIHELPGGSSHDPTKSLVEVVHEELSEEVGLDIALERFQMIESRQLAPTLSTHRGTLFFVEATDEEIDFVRNISRPQGVPDEHEQTYPEVHKVRDLVTNQSVDWTTLGMILAALK